MKSKGNTLTKSNSKLKSSINDERSIEIINYSLFKESEIVVKALLEKIISLVISKTFEKMVDNNLANFCLTEIKNKIDNIIGIQFIKHDKDDLNRRKIITNKSQDNIIKIIKRKIKKKILLLTDDKIVNNNFNKSQIIPSYELINNLNNFSANYFRKKTVLNILTRKDNFFQISQKENKNKNNKIIEQKKINNFWDTVLQPKNTKIDRRAATKIKIDKESFKGIFLDNIQENIKEENPIQEKIEIKQNTSNKETKKNNKKEEKKEKEKKLKKIKVLIQTDLPSFDLEPDKIPINDENESIKILREEYENKLAKKKEKEEKEKKFMAQKQLLLENDIENNNNNKKIFLNTNVNTVKIKPIKLENLIAEFKDIKSKSKEIGRITDINAETQSEQNNNYKNIKIEINENPNYQFTEEKTDRKRKKHNNPNNQNNPNNKNNSNNNLNIVHIINKKNRREKKDNEFLEKSGSKFASGSNFNLIKLECGVDLTENRKKKSGGKNYFEKYGRFSYELYQNRLNKTMSENFILNELKEAINNDMKNEENENGFKRKDNIKKSYRKNIGLIPNKELIREKSDYEAIYEVDNIDDNNLKIKAKKLKIVMNNLDLMKDFQMNNDSEKNQTYHTKFNFFKNKINQNFKKGKNDLREINNFNKTVMKNNFWGEPENQNMKENINIKPPLHFLHSLKKKVYYPIIGLPRQRLPPISTIRVNNFNMIKSGSGTNFQKIKINNLSKDDIKDDEKKHNFI